MEIAGRRLPGCVVVLLLIVSFCVFAGIWGHFHRRVFLLGGPSGPWRVTVDGEPAPCEAVGQVVDEASAAAATARCELVLGPGSHELVARDLTGREVQRARASVEGSGSLLWIVELPSGACVRSETIWYRVASRYAAPDPPEQRTHPLGLSEIERIDYWFVEPPSVVRVDRRSTSDLRRSLRLVPCGTTSYSGIRSP